MKYYLNPEDNKSSKTDYLDLKQYQIVQKVKGHAQNFMKSLKPKSNPFRFLTELTKDRNKGNDSYISNDILQKILSHKSNVNYQTSTDSISQLEESKEDTNLISSSQDLSVDAKIESKETVPDENSIPPIANDLVSNDSLDTSIVSFENNNIESQVNDQNNHGNPTLDNPVSINLSEQNKESINNNINISEQDKESINTNINISEQDKESINSNINISEAVLTDNNSSDSEIISEKNTKNDITHSSSNITPSTNNHSNITPSPSTITSSPPTTFSSIIKTYFEAIFFLFSFEILHELCREILSIYFPLLNTLFICQFLTSTILILKEKITYYYTSLTTYISYRITHQQTIKDPSPSFYHQLSLYIHGIYTHSQLILNDLYTISHTYSNNMKQLQQDIYISDISTVSFPEIQGMILRIHYNLLEKKLFSLQYPIISMLLTDITQTYEYKLFMDDLQKYINELHNKISTYNSDSIFSKDIIKASLNDICYMSQTYISIKQFLPLLISLYNIQICPLVNISDINSFIQTIYALEDKIENKYNMMIYKNTRHLVESLQTCLVCFSIKNNDIYIETLEQYSIHLNQYIQYDKTVELLNESSFSVLLTDTSANRQLAHDENIPSEYIEERDIQNSSFKDFSPRGNQENDMPEIPLVPRDYRNKLNNNQHENVLKDPAFKDYVNQYMQLVSREQQHQELMNVQKGILKASINSSIQQAQNYAQQNSLFSTISQLLKSLYKSHQQNAKRLQQQELLSLLSLLFHFNWISCIIWSIFCLLSIYMTLGHSPSLPVALWNATQHLFQSILYLFGKSTVPQFVYYIQNTYRNMQADFEEQNILFREQDILYHTKSASLPFFKRMWSNSLYKINHIILGGIVDTLSFYGHLLLAIIIPILLTSILIYILYRSVGNSLYFFYFCLPILFILSCCIIKYTLYKYTSNHFQERSIQTYILLRMYIYEIIISVILLLLLQITYTLGNYNQMF
ncbi:hypothetical protein WA158_008298 [Blastocystis sp. Blastoise]